MAVITIHKLSEDSNVKKIKDLSLWDFNQKAVYELQKDIPTNYSFTLPKGSLLIQSGKYFKWCTLDYSVNEEPINNSFSVQDLKYIKNDLAAIICDAVVKSGNNAIGRADAIRNTIISVMNEDILVTIHNRIHNSGRIYEKYETYKDILILNEKQERVRAERDRLKSEDRELCFTDKDRSCILELIKYKNKELETLPCLDNGGVDVHVKETDNFNIVYADDIHYYAHRCKEYINPLTYYKDVKIINWPN